MKRYKYIGIMMMAAGMLTATSCSDFDDYNKEVADATRAEATHTLWENIENDSRLSNFKALIEKADFAEALNTTHYYTVWAPVNGSWYNEYKDMSKSNLLRQFVKNHIADYSHSASGTIDERVMMLNEKSYNFTGLSPYTFNEVKLTEANVPSINGVIHVIDSAAAFYPNLYEFVMDTLMTQKYGLNKLHAFFDKYERTYLNEDASVLGPIENGLQTYVDSVMVTTNLQWNLLNTKMNNEDSSYVFLLPTDEVWQAAYDSIKPNFNYIANIKAEQFVNNTISSTPATIALKPAYWQDSITTSFMTRYLSYSNNDAYNKWLNGTPSTFGSDTLRTTSRSKLSNPQQILAAKTDVVKMSNGEGYIVNNLAMYPWETYAPERSVSAASSNNRARINLGNYMNISLDLSDNTYQEDFNYIRIVPAQTSNKPELDIYLRDVLSTTYDIYCVFVPPFDMMTDTTYTPLPNRVIFTLNYCDKDGNLVDKEFLNEDSLQAAAFQEEFNLNAKTYNTTIKAFSNDPMKIDTVFVGEFTFPVCYYGLGTEYCPNIKITSPFPVIGTNGRKMLAAYTRDLRIASIILKPKELVEFEESNKQ